MSEFKPKDMLSNEELEPMKAEGYVFYEAGKPYLWTQGFGWGIIGFFVKYLTPTRIMVAHANHFRNAGKDYGRLGTEGAGPECEWRYEGTIEMNLNATIKAQRYYGMVNRNPGASAAAPAAQ